MKDEDGEKEERKLPSKTLAGRNRVPTFRKS